MVSGRDRKGSADNRRNHDTVDCVTRWDLHRDSMGVSVKEKRDCVSSLSENGKFSMIHNSIITQKETKQNG